MEVHGGLEMSTVLRCVDKNMVETWTVVAQLVGHRPANQESPV